MTPLRQNTLDEGRSIVSVVTIFLNGEKFLDEAIGSVLAQTNENWEYLLVDDGSTDGSTAIAQDWAQRHPEKIRYLEHPNHENRGMSASRNRGLGNARGEFVAFLDADDVWLPRKLEEQLEILEAQPRAAMVYGRTEIWNSWTGAEQGRDHILDLGVPDDTLVESPELLLLLLENRVQTPTTCSAMFRRKVFADLGGFEDSFRGMFEDQAFFAKVCLEFPVFVSGRCWARYRQHPDSCCAVAAAAGSLSETRLLLLQWIEGYLARRHLSDPRVRKTLRREFWLCRHPLARRIIKVLRRRWFRAKEYR
jgi:glycosyltransferase involved in cell wall biosynthesis